MWFKTRVGLVSLKEEFSVRVARYPDVKHPYYSIFARPSGDTEVSYKGIFGKFTAPGIWIHLAHFSFCDKADSSIAECLGLIESAIAGDAKICDLSEIGDAEAWSNASKDWVLVKW